MELPSRQELLTLLSRQDQSSVTLILPLHRSWPHNLEDAIEFRDLVDQAFGLLRQEGVSEEQAEELLQFARKLCEDKNFWKSHGAASLAVLLAPGISRHYLLPFSCHAVVEVGDRFYLAPLVQSLNWQVDFYVLAVSRKQTRLFRGDDDTLTRVTLPADVPESLEAALATSEFDPAREFHSTPGFGRGTSGTVHAGTSGLLHGHGDSKADQKMLTEQYIQSIAHGLTPLLERDGLPLVLATVGYYHPVFRAACHYSKLLETGLTGSGDHFNEQELREGAAALVRGSQQKQVELLLARFETQRGSGRGSNLLRRILPAAREGRVDSIIVESGTRLWGQSPAESDGSSVVVHTERQPGDIDLLDEAVRQTFTHRGEAFMALPDELPKGTSVVALFRW